ncbi:MAG TPA: hypothetical protein P5298_03580 [Spirochaetia bacterium]|nr:hypothetical protein [Spirochaetaceae bacterium]HPE89136.1 hypothetical protein [Spirochaetales bacterium]HRW23469.1 hypothetical protein [Spirochaetia bacterium]
MAKHVIDEVPGFYRIIELKPLRRGSDVSLDIMPMEYLSRIDSIERVVHRRFALSPGAVGEVERPWYMHACQEDTLLVLHGSRSVELYAARHRRIESFVVEPERIVHDGETVYDGPATLMWHAGVFHRSTTGDAGAASINFSARLEGFDPLKNYNVYDLDIVRAKATLLRSGYLDTSPG